MSKSIEINYLGDSGYEALYPNTMLNSVLDWQENLYSKDEILDSATKALYGLGEDVVPDDVLAILSKAALLNQDGSISTSTGVSISRASIVSGTYTGTGTYGASGKTNVSFDKTPKAVFVSQRVGVFYYGGIILPTVGLVYIGGTEARPSGVEFCSVNTNFGTTVSWYSGGENARYQLNVSGSIYNYFAIFE